MEKGTMSVNKVDVPPECVMRSQDMKVSCKLAHTPPFRGGSSVSFTGDLFRRSLLRIVLNSACEYFTVSFARAREACVRSESSP